ncbi:hypothetical protein NFI95_09185 [Acetobacteraceae bacterium KSS8]|uniref:MaoC-like domain-containing protein n=1 Tax=Endosaccharibacter trunci TaxID=2812733 RepID=A0ABT1W6W8_9PROT|nr:hypothetical protein [Acetobacteraceae bacterium KSS8]
MSAMSDRDNNVRVLSAPPSARDSMLGGLQSLRRRASVPLVLPDTVLQLDRQRLEPRRIAAYAKLCGFSPDQGVPATFPHMLGFPLHMALLLEPAFPYPLIGLVHLANTIRQHEALRAGETLDVAVRFGEPLHHDKGQAFTVLTEMRRGGDTVWESGSTYLRLGVRQAEGQPVPPPPVGPQPLAVAGRWRQPRSIGPRYAAVSGDRNPIHTSRLGARLLGFRSPIAHGMWMLAKSAAALLPETPVRTAEIEVAFRAPAFLPGSALLLATQRQTGTLFELRNGRAEQLHLRGLLRAEAA